MVSPNCLVVQDFVIDVVDWQDKVKALKFFLAFEKSLNFLAAR
jgi:hypothetical protein